MKDITEAALASKALRCMLAALIALASALGTLGVQGKSAYAAESANLTTGGKIHYGGYHTTWMEADGEMAYCADPQSATPSPGSYAKSSIDAPSGRNAEVVADLWFAYGSPGFDASLWPDKWYDGTEMTASRYAACAHILVSDTYTSDGSYALYGCNADSRAGLGRTSSASVPTEA